MEEQSVLIDLFCMFLKKDVNEKMKWRCVKISEIEKERREVGTKKIPKRVRSISQDIEHEYLWNDKKAGVAIPQNMGGGGAAEETHQKLKAECEQPLNTNAFKAGER